MKRFVGCLMMLFIAAGCGDAEPAREGASRPVTSPLAGVAVDAEVSKEKPDAPSPRCDAIRASTMHSETME